jgi:hypothetical protein
MLKNIIWMISGLSLGLLIWAAYAQYKKAKDKKAAEAAAAAAAAEAEAPTPTTTPIKTPTPTPGPGPAVNNGITRNSPLTNNSISDY